MLARLIVDEDALVGAFATLGKTSRIPTMWIYAQNDKFFGPELVRRMHTAFTAAGGQAQFVDARDLPTIFRRACTGPLPSRQWEPSRIAADGGRGEAAEADLAACAEYATDCALCGRRSPGRHRQRRIALKSFCEPQACRSGVDTTRPSRSSLTLIWQDRREFGRTSKPKSSMSSSIGVGEPTFSRQASST